jgi:hypothetical protein
MIYKHTINTSLESNNVNDDDVIELRTLYSFFILSGKYKIKVFKTTTF